MSWHVIKYEFKHGRKLAKPESWCGHRVALADELVFRNAQQAALSSGGVAPCKKCIKAIIAQLEKEL